ncbi:RipA family octameric membrane protein [Anaerovibrio lipolyticus]|uniref:RipA family octameric membrane protein n=1 Tax=Anaerovibrio lipolyticus TaxID=82374 RepID=UPI000684F958|nr:hypothetical protein [Anaerovibrio lipolyticus]
MDIFVSYSFKDKILPMEIFSETANDKLIFLRECHIPVLWKWLAKEKIIKSDCLVCIVTRNTIYSGNIEWEINTAITNGKTIFYYIHELNAVIPDILLKNGVVIRTRDIYNAVKKYNDENITNTLLSGKSIFDVDDKKKFEFLFEQYKIIVNTVETLSKRRQNMHNFFVIINGGLFSGFGIVAKNISDFHNISRGTACIIVFISLVGYMSSYSWEKQIVSYRQLSSGKFKIINKMEEWLPAAIFTAEWQALREGKDKKVYLSFTVNEQNIPNILMIIYTIFVVIGCLYIFLGEFLA